MQNKKKNNTIYWKVRVEELQLKSKPIKTYFQLKP